MKKIILTLLFVWQLLPGRQANTGLISFTAGYTATAQIMPCTDPSGPGGCGSGGAFWNWLGRAFGNVGDVLATIGRAVANYFIKPGDPLPPGENMSNEDGDWHWEPEGWLPSEANQQGGPYDPWADEYWQNMGMNMEEMTILQNWQYYHGLYMAGDTAAVPLPNQPKYYIVKDFIEPGMNDTGQRRYDQGDTIYMAVSKYPQKLILRRENSAVNLTDLQWKRNDSIKCTGTDNCNFYRGQESVTALLVDSANVTMRTKNTLVVYRPPTIVFERGSNYNGEYGFDDSAHKHIFLRNDPRYKKGYEYRTINGDTPYIVPWMSLLDKQSATIRIKKLHMDTKAKDDPHFWVEFKATTENITLNGMSQLRFNYAQLVNLKTMDVYAKQWDDSAQSFKITGDICAVTNSGDTIGKLKVSCVKPQRKKLVLVYVQFDDDGYRTNIDTAKLLDKLNKHSHNQLFRQWVMDTAYSDTLDARAEYAAYPQWFDHEISAYTRMVGLYESHKGLLLANVNNNYRNSSHPNKVYFCFIVNKSYPILDANGDVIGYATGRTPLGSDFSVIYKDGDYATIVHELGHVLNLFHTFPSPPGLGSPYLIPLKSTTNWMDYYEGTDKRNMLYYSQWMEIH